MNQDRRKFLQKFATVCAGGIARKLGVGVGAAVTSSAAAATAVSASTAAVAATRYGTGVRAQVFEVIVRQATVGAPWQEICQGPMQINGITVEEVEREVARRASVQHTDKGACLCAGCMKARLERTRRYNELLAEIPHSERSPCAFANCRDAINAIMAEKALGFSFPDKEI